VEIYAKEALRLRELLNEILAKPTGQPIKQIAKDPDRGYFMSAAQATDYLSDR
jgi:ATP-dependent Clp protease protease subunit